MPSETQSQYQSRLPIVILMQPQIGENIGMAARAMLNCGLSEMRIVKPREKWPNPKALAAAKKAEIVIEKAKVFSSLEEAVTDCCAIYASSARLRVRNIPTISPEQAAVEMLETTKREKARSAMLFGPENNGLDNHSLAIADRVVHASLNQECPSLNLAQAVFMLAWEWWKLVQEKGAAGGGEAQGEGASGSGSEGASGSGSEASGSGGEGVSGSGGEGVSGSGSEASSRKDGSQLANKGEMLSFLARLEEELEAGGFFRSCEQRPEIRKNLHALAMRARPSKQELRTLQGVISALAKK